MCTQVLRLLCVYISVYYARVHDNNYDLIGVFTTYSLGFNWQVIVDASGGREVEERSRVVGNG